jgi:uncharacterized Ntn-hydrolase superfamily protein
MGARRLASTFSIVALDPKTRELGVAVQSRYFSVGSGVPWARAGVGAIATQSLVEVSYGPLGLRRLGRGASPRDVLEALTARDPRASVRQVGVVDATGRSAAWTGRACIPYAGHAIGRNYAVQGNLLASARVWPAMARAFERTGGRLAERLVRALEAGQAAGGDARGVQSACLLVVGPGQRGKPWTERKIDLRVEDHPAPIRELRRLLAVQRAYDLAGEAESLYDRRDAKGAFATYRRALALAPGNDELRFWRAALYMRAGRDADALRDLRRATRENPRWIRLLARLQEEHFPRAPEALRRLRASRRG